MNTHTQKKWTGKIKDKQKAHLPSFFFFFYHNCSLLLLQLEEDPCSRKLNGAEMITLPIKICICYGPSFISQLWPGCIHTTHCPPIHSYCLYICNLHPHLCLECLARDQLPHCPTPQLKTKTPLILQQHISSNCHTM